MTYRTFDGTSQVETLTDGRYSSDGSQYLRDMEKLNIGTNEELQIWTDVNDNTYIYHKPADAASGHLKILTDSFSIRDETDTEDITHFAANGSCKLYEDNELRFETVDGGAKVTGTFTITSLPTSDPSAAGQLWNDSGTVKVSAG